MADFERALVAKVAQTQAIDRLMAEGITPEHFSDPENADIWRFMCDHAIQYRGAPSFATVLTRFPNHGFEKQDDQLEYIRDQFFTQVKQRYAMEALEDLAREIEDPNIDELFLERARRLAQSVPSTRISRFSDMEKRIEAYEKFGGLPSGIDLGIPQFDKLTQGVQPHEYITIAGWQGTGKSTLAQWMLFNAWQQGKTPMYVSMEMEASALFRKWDTMMVNFEYQALKEGNLTDKELDAWKKAASQVKMGSEDIITIDDVRDCSVDKVYGEIVRHQPDIVCVDYISLLRAPKHAGSSHWETVTYITNQLKATARNLNVPIIGIAQTNANDGGEGASLNNIAYSRSIGQDSDMVFGLFRDEEMIRNKQMGVRMLKNRDGRTGEEKLTWEMDRMIFKPWHPFQTKTP